MLSLAHRLTVDANETARQMAKDLLRYIIIIADFRASESARQIAV